MYLILIQVPSGNDWLQCSDGLSGFIVSFKETGSDQLYTENIPPDMRTATIQYLNPCTQYEFTVHARNKDAHGTESEAVEQATEPTGKIHWIFSDY